MWKSLRENPPATFARFAERELLEAVEPMSGAWGDVLVSVYTTLFSAALLVIGFVRRDRRLRYRLTQTIPNHGGHICRIDLSPIPVARKPGTFAV